MRHGITEKTVDELIIGPGALYKNFISPSSPGTLLGATIGGNTFRVTTEWYVPEFDGALGPIKGTRRKVREIPTLEVNLVEVTKENLLLALAGAAAEDYGSPKTHDRITPRPTLTSADYLDNVAIVAEKAGSQNPMVIIVKNAVHTEPLEMPLGTGREDVKLVLTFTGHYSAASPDVPPYEILNPATV